RPPAPSRPAGPPRGAASNRPPRPDGASDWPEIRGSAASGGSSGRSWVGHSNRPSRKGKAEKIGANSARERPRHCRYKSESIDQGNWRGKERDVEPARPCDPVAIRSEDLVAPRSRALHHHRLL